LHDLSGAAVHEEDGLALGTKVYSG
jgi:hypothetical protein